MSRPIWAAVGGVALLGTAVGLSVFVPGCSSEEELTADTPTLLGVSPSPISTSTVTPTVLSTHTSSPGSGSINGMITGPSQARPGEILTYQVTFDTGGTASVVLGIETLGADLQFVSWNNLNGTASPVGEPRYLRWEIGDTGSFEISLLVPTDAAPTTFTVSAYVVGTEIGSQFQAATTTITDQQTTS